MIKIRFDKLDFLLTGLQLMFIYLKLTEQINWSWWLVLLPILIPISILLLFLVVGGFLIIVLWLREKLKR